ncbi:MAG: hypothetical protein LAN59_11915 [Acidobacteriia bacterium]|nr:hypothetical protein [Terriglobia bacterium]
MLNLSIKEIAFDSKHLLALFKYPQSFKKLRGILVALKSKTKGRIVTSKA